MWNPEALKAVAQPPENDVTLEALLLTHERWRGRTEEDYPATKAESEFQALLKRYNGPFPAPRPGEYLGLTQLRQYVQSHTTIKVEEAESSAPQAIIPMGMTFG